MQFRLIDTYGNALAEAAHTVQFDALYHDPLVPLGEWPGTQATYRVARNEADQPCVFLTLDFQPDEIVRSDVHRFMALDRNGSGDDKARQQAETMLANARSEIEADLDSAKRHLSREAEETARILADRILDRA